MRWRRAARGLRAPIRPRPCVCRRARRWPPAGMCIRPAIGTAPRPMRAGPPAGWRMSATRAARWCRSASCISGPARMTTAFPKSVCPCMWWAAWAGPSVCCATTRPPMMMPPNWPRMSVWVTAATPSMTARSRPMPVRGWPIRRAARATVGWRLCHWSARIIHYARPRNSMAFMIRLKWTCRWPMIRPSGPPIPSCRTLRGFLIMTAISMRKRCGRPRPPITG